MVRRMKTRVMSVAAATALLAVGVAGCAKPTNVAVRSLGCPAEKIEFEMEKNPMVTTGCGRVDVIGEIARGEYASLRERAAFDLNCPSSELEIVPLDALTYGVVGRGQRLVYKMVYGVGFTLDSTSTAEGSVQPATTSVSEASAPPTPPG